MAVEPALHRGDAGQLVLRGSAVGGKGTERGIIVEDALRDVVGALPRRAGVCVVEQVALILTGAHVEGIERGVVVVAQPAPDGPLRTDLWLLPGQDVHAGEHGVVVEGVPVEVLHVVAQDERLQSLTLLQGALLHLLAGLGQDECLQVVGAQERVFGQFIILDFIARRHNVAGPALVFAQHIAFIACRLDLCIVEVDVLQMSEIVA